MIALPRLTLLAVPLLLAACNANLGPVGVSIGGGAQAAKAIPNAAEYAELDHSVPRGVQALLPPGVRPFDVRERDLCYAYLASGALVPVLRADGTQYCLK